MKALARSYVWWLKLNDEIEELVRTCSVCQMSCHAPAQAPTHPWEVTRKPWERLHIDFAGPFDGKIFLIVVDSFSKWLEVVLVRSTTSSSVINNLRRLFATHGVPRVIVSDNATAFTSEEFGVFARRNAIRHVMVAPYHPSSNGQAERMVQMTKESLKRIIAGDWSIRLARFLLSQHITPSSSTGFSPAELLMNRNLHTCLDLMHPDVHESLQEKKDSQASKAASKLRTFAPFSPVYMRKWGTGSKWRPATIVKRTGPVSYMLKTPDGETHKRHVDHLRSRQVALSEVVNAAPNEANQEEESPTNFTRLPPHSLRNDNASSARRRKRPKLFDDFVT
ncbi:hypothetical protein M514_00022, partial [Trichuris suis]